MGSGKSGFSIVEVLVGSAIAMLTALFVASQVQQMSQGTSTATTSLSHMDLRTQIVAVLSDKSNCAGRLKPKDAITGTITVASGDFTAIASDPPLLILNPAGAPLIQDGDIRDGVQYSITLDHTQSFPMAKLPDDLPADQSVMRFNRYLATIQLTANRNVPTAPQGTRALGSESLVAPIPIMLEFDQVTGNLASCSTAPSGVEDSLLYAPSGVAPKKVNECLLANGFPYTTELGVMCWFPTTAAQQQALNNAALAGDLLPQPLCPAGWNPIMDPVSGSPWVTIQSTGESFRWSRSCNTSICPGQPSIPFGPADTINPTSPSRNPVACPGMRMCQKTCSGFSVPLGTGGAIGGAYLLGPMGTIGALAGLFCLRKRCHCSGTFTFGYTYVIKGSGCY